MKNANQLIANKTFFTKPPTKEYINKMLSKAKEINKRINAENFNN